MNQQLDVLLVDDERISLDILQSSLKVFNYINVVGEVTNGNDVIKYLQQYEVDVIFLDIMMQDVNGFELAEHIQSIYPDVLLVFLTGNVDFALGGYEYRPVDFLIKPVPLLRLERALSKVRELKYSTKERKASQIGIHVEGGMEIINISDITYIEKSGRKVYICCEGGKKIHSSDSLQKLESVFAEYNFFRSHQSFLVPLERIESIHIDDFKRSYRLRLKNVKDILPLSRDKHSELKKCLSRKGMKFH
ncbi:MULTISPECIES: LytR/AlgR family response regulator transcription factor [Paenibacillus]|uniref:LytTR family two component transcriptional regulator n=1 Tax=Paenibacillus pabuli TaxID=1472 RepID=A0A855XN69_9BACL|nr:MULTISPECIES: LytTR family DNA-binding domain-containing protein [Paenibacillus]PWW32701.1 LytTR family two component transcriptional regulator [Paenibacillus pabuli]PXV98350.1 LytTR family two component transcriptional regulator [Paenibacillus taichungensis]